MSTTGCSEGRGENLWKKIYLGSNLQNDCSNQSFILLLTVSLHICEASLFCYESHVTFSEGTKPTTEKSIKLIWRESSCLSPLTRNFKTEHLGLEIWIVCSIIWTLWGSMSGKNGMILVSCWSFRDFQRWVWRRKLLRAKSMEAALDVWEQYSL